MPSPIKTWREDERPREKLLAHGPEALADAELLAILIGSGQPGESAVQLMARVLEESGGSLSRLGKRGVRDLMRYKGIGEAKAVTIAAACELGRRRQTEDLTAETAYSSSQTIYRLMRQKLRDADTEEAWVLLLNRRLRLLRAQRVARGGMTETLVDVRVVMREALLAGSTVIVLCHNHPSGNPVPSVADDRLTEQVRQAADTLNICLADHLIVCEADYYSYRDNGRLH